MSGKCTVCSHPDFLEINQKLASPGVVYSELAQRFNLGRKAAERHVAHCLDHLKTSGIGDVYARIEIEKLFARVESLQAEVNELRLRLESAQNFDNVVLTSVEEVESSSSETVFPVELQDASSYDLLKQKLREMISARSAHSFE